MEIFDIVDEQGRPTGGQVERGEAHREGILHRTAHVWIVRGCGGATQVLLQKRSACKDSFPGEYDTSSAGHIPAGDEPVASALRELGEELGIAARPEELIPVGTFRIRYEKVFHGRVFRDNEFTFVYALDRPVRAEELRLQPEEIEAVEWFDLDRVCAACADGSRAVDGKPVCVPDQGLALIRAWCAARDAG